MVSTAREALCSSYSARYPFLFRKHTSPKAKCVVPVPAFTMEEATVNFTMEVKDSTSDKLTQSDESTLQSSLSAWGFSTTISGKVTTSRENTRTSDKTAKYDIYARAAQQPAAEGMAKLSSIFASVIEPITSSGSSTT